MQGWTAPHSAPRPRRKVGEGPGWDTDNWRRVFRRMGRAAARAREVQPPLTRENLLNFGRDTEL